MGSDRSPVARLASLMRAQTDVALVRKEIRKFVLEGSYLVSRKRLIAERVIECVPAEISNITGIALSMRSCAILNDSPQNACPFVLKRSRQPSLAFNVENTPWGNIGRFYGGCLLIAPATYRGVSLGRCFICKINPCSERVFDSLSIDRLADPAAAIEHTPRLNRLNKPLGFLKIPGS